jgi:dipeptidyl aminopeptidase/acylaminoacyl peptidase
VTDFDLAGDMVVYGAMRSSQPTDLWRTSVAGGEPARLTSLNGALTQAKHPAEAQLIALSSFDGTAIEAWLLPPAGFDPAAKSTYPLVLSIHGGPHGAYGEAYHHSFQSFAAAGAFVLYVNPRGSQGYGESFAKSVIGDWGGGDYKDIMAAVDHVMAQGRVDATRLYAWGASYGGFMTTWIAGQTDRFRAICSVIPVTDLLSFYGTSDIGHYFGPFEMGGQPWEVRERYVAMSPLTHAANVVTPILLVHHENDLRCPISQSEQYFVTLKSMGKQVEFLRIPDASHGIVAPTNARAEVVGLDAAHDWFASYGLRD